MTDEPKTKWWGGDLPNEKLATEWLMPRNIEMGHFILTKTLIDLNVGDILYEPIKVLEYTGYLIPCDGRLVNKSDYPELYKKIGNLYGKSTSEKFHVPDFREEHK